MIYCPEMGGKPEPRLFATRHNFRDSYSVTWPKSKDAEARAKFKELNIRALKCSPIRAETLGQWSPLRLFNEDGFSCLISGHAHDKIFAADLCAHEMLLD
ncbi:hypothetical protein RHDC4_03084 [Rhodocyclaceae bacterium]|nr:hypothetical protein RHDC4_03084 [Rhodocyclaceae bacterium]